MKAPQIIMIVWMAMSLGAALIKDGDEKEGNYSFWQTLFTLGLEFAVLKWGGFF